MCPDTSHFTQISEGISSLLDKVYHINDLGVRNEQQ